MKSLRYSIGPGLLILLLCTAVVAEENSMPADTPPVQQITKSADPKNVLEIDQTVLQELDDGERDWYKRFQQGILFFDGWSSISEEILASYPEEQIVEKKPIVQRLGVKIGSEWCKDNDVRRIDTAMLKSWGKQLRASINQGHEITTQTLLEIENEVNLILENEDQVTLVSPPS